MTKTCEMIREIPRADRTPCEEEDPSGAYVSNFSSAQIAKNSHLRRMIDNGDNYTHGMRTAQATRQMGVNYNAHSDQKRQNREWVSQKLADRNMTYEGIGASNRRMHTVSNPSIFRTPMAIEEDKARHSSLHKTVRDRDAMRKQVHHAKFAM